MLLPVVALILKYPAGKDASEVLASDA